MKQLQHIWDIWREEQKRVNAFFKNVCSCNSASAALPNANHQPEVEGQTHLYLLPNLLAAFQFGSVHSLQTFQRVGRFLDGLWRANFACVFVCVHVCVCVWMAGNGCGPLLFWQKVANGSGSKKTDRSFKMVANALRWLPGWERGQPHTHTYARAHTQTGCVANVSVWQKILKCLWLKIWRNVCASGVFVCVRFAVGSASLAAAAGWASNNGDG